MDKDKLIGKTIGQYKILEYIGGGGMGAVYRASDEGLGRDIAIKIMSAELIRADIGYLERFKREARYSATLDHPNIITIYTFGQQEDMTYIVMKLLNGGSLEQRMKQRPSKPASPGEIAKLLLQVGPALDHAHAKELIHRDIKPGNIIFDDAGKAYLVDFGIAKMRTADMGAALTNANVVMGTSSYMPPEQWRGELQPASDQYALGVTIYHMLTHRLPFEAPDNSALMYKILHESPLPMNLRRIDLSPETIAVVERALNKVPEARWPSCTAFAEAFNATIPDHQRIETGFFTYPVVRSQPSKKTDNSNWSESSSVSKESPRKTPVDAVKPVTRALTSVTIAKAIKHKHFPYYSLGGVIVIASVALVLALTMPFSPPATDVTATPSPTIAVTEQPTDTSEPTATLEPSATHTLTDTPEPTATDTPEPTLAPVVGGTVRAIDDIQLRRDNTGFVFNTGTLPAGEMAEILDIESDSSGVEWLLLRTTEDIEGWARTSAVEIMPSP